jgi:MoxR-like ATPase
MKGLKICKPRCWIPWKSNDFSFPFREKAMVDLAPREIYRKITTNIESVMRGQSAATRKLLAGFAGGGHVLLEDYPGTGKTTLAKTLALSIDGVFKRIQFTPDLLPSDILGVSIFDQKDQVFRLHRGPIFTNVLLDDEINRASPRTQSALLEAMAEKQVSIDALRISFSSWRLRIRWNPVEPIPFLRPKWIVSPSASVSDMWFHKKRWPFSPTREKAIP